MNKTFFIYLSIRKSAFVNTRNHSQYLFKWTHLFNLLHLVHKVAISIGLSSHLFLKFKSLLFIKVLLCFFNKT